MLRRRVYEVLEVASPGDRLSQIVDVALIALVAANIAAIILESIDSLFVSHGAFFATFETLSVMVFTVEYGLRIWSASEREAPAGASSWQKRRAHAASPMAVADLLAILPFYLTGLFQMDLRFLRVLRLLRIFKLTRYSRAMSLLLQVLYTERRAFGAALSLLVVAVIFASSGIYLAEHRVQPEAFASIPAAMWWALVTLTTVGYGDVTPITPIGKLFASTVMIIGVGMAALPTGLIAAGFAEANRQNRERLQQELDSALEDGVVTAEEEQSFHDLAEKLGVSEERAAKIREAALGGLQMSLPDSCPHCGKGLDE